MPTITDATVVAQAYDTSGNGGRKLVRLDNGWLVSVVKTTDYFYFYKTEKGDWSDKTQLCYITHSNIDNSDISIVSVGNTVHALYGWYTSGVFSCSFNATTITNINLYDNRVTVETMAQTALGNVSLAINEAKTELHATWASKNSTYSSSFNIRYAKGTINADGTVTWGAVEQVTIKNISVVDLKNPSIVLVNGSPTIAIERYNASSYYILMAGKNIDRTAWADETSSSWGMKTIYGGGTYTQSSPSAIFVPQSINGLGSGLISNAWHGTDSTSGGVNYIRFSKSIDGGVTWSTMQKLVVGTNATLTANKNGKLFITYEDAGVTKHIESTDNGDTWSSAITVGTGTNPSTLFDLRMSFSAPLTIRKGTSSVLFSGTWTVTTISVTPGDIGQKTDKNNILSYSITTDGEMSTITEKINGTVVNTRNTTSGQAVTLGLTQAQWDAIRFGKYADATGGKNTLTVEMGSEKWTYTFDKQLASDSDIISASKAVKDANEVYLPVQISRLADVAKGKGAVIPANPKIDDIVDGIKKSANGRVLSGIATSSSTPSQYEVLNSTSAYNFYTVTVTGLTFKPKRIVIKPQNTSASIVYLTEYHYAMSSYQNEQVFIIGYQPTYVTNAVLVGLKADKNGLSVTSTGFTLPGKDANVVYEWTAYEN